MEEGLEEVLRLALCLALLGAQPLEFVDDALFVESGLEHEWREKARNARKPFASSVSFVSFVIQIPSSHNSPSKRSFQQRLKQVPRLALRFALPGTQVRLATDAAAVVSRPA